MECRNHPSRSARRRCFLCKIPICPDCQRKAEHHIFCGTACVDRYREHETGQPRTVEDRLLGLDESLTEEIHESNSIAAEAVATEFQKLEEELDQALTTLATMVEGSAVAAAADLEKSTRSLAESIQKGDRLGEDRTLSIKADIQGLEQTLRTVRSHLVEYRENTALELKATHEALVEASKQLNSLQSQVNEASERQIQAQKQFREHLSETIETNTETLTGVESLQGSVSAQSKELLNRVTSLEETLRRLQAEAEQRAKDWKRTLEDVPDRISREAQSIMAHIGDEIGKLNVAQAKADERVDEWKQAIEEAPSQITREVQAIVSKGLAAQALKLEDFERDLRERIDVRLGRIVDDIATLNIAQMGNWNQVVAAAKKGAQVWTEKAKSEALAKLTLEPPPAHRKSRWSRSALAGIASLMIAGIAGMAWWGKERADRKYHDLEAKWSARESQLKAQLDEQIAAMKEATSRPANPKPAAVVEMTRGDPTKREVAFTFDGGGENARSAVGILDALKARGIHSTIFVTGQFIQEHPDLVRRMVGEGHEIANHLVEHKAVVDEKRRSIVTRDELVGQLRKVQTLFTEATGKEMSKLWRAPYGELNREVLDWASQAGYTHVGWTRSGRASLDTLDWVADPKSSLYRTPNQIMEKILHFEKSDRNGLNGAVVLMHLGSERTKDYPYESLPKLLDEVSKRGYHAVTVGDLLRTTVASR